MTRITLSKSVLFPEDWVPVTLKDTGLIGSGGTPDTTKPEFWQGDILWCTPTDVTTLKGKKYISETSRKISEAGLKNSSATILPANSLVICTRATVGDCAINRVQLTTNQGFKTIVPNNRWSIDYLYYLINSLKSELVKVSSGSTFLELSKKAFENIRTHRPPIEEQLKIAEILSTVDDKINIITSQISETEKLKQGLMQQLLTMGIGNTVFKSSELGEIPERWDVTKLSKVIRLQGGFAFKSADATDTGVKWLKIANVGIQAIVWNEKSYLPEGFDKLYSGFVLNKGDIVIAMTRPILGDDFKIARVTNEDEGALLNQRVGRLICGPKMDSGFAYQILNSSLFVSRLKKEILGTDPPNIGSNTFDNITIALPPIEEQVKIAEILVTIDDKIAILRRKKNYFKDLKTGLMQQLLTGKIRVNNNQPESAVA